MQVGEPGQVRKEAAIADHCKCRGKARLPISEAMGMRAFQLLAAMQAQAVDGVYAESGAGNSAYIARIGMVWKWNRI